MTKSTRLGVAAGIILLSGAVLVFVPPLIGAKIEKSYENVFNRLAAHNALLEYASSYKFERHWFESYVTKEVQYEGHTLTSVTRIAHGPLAHTKAKGWYLGMGAPFELLSVVVDDAQEFNDIHAHGVVTLLGNFTIDAIIDGIEINNANIAPVSFNAVGNVDDFINLNIQLPKLSIIVKTELKGPKETLQVASEIAYKDINITAEADLSDNPTGLFFPSEIELSVKRYSVHTNIEDLDESSFIALNDLVYSVKTGLSGETPLVNSHQLITVGGFQMNQDKTGPFEASIQVNNIEIEPYLYIIDQLGKNPALVSTLRTDEKMGAAIDKLFSNKPELVIDQMKLMVLDSAVEASMILQVDSEADWRTISPLELMELQSQIILPKPILYVLVEMYVKNKLMPALLKTPDLKFSPAEIEAAEKEFIVKTMYDLEFMKLIEPTEDKRYRTEVSLQAGQLLVNGNPLISLKGE